MDRLISTEPREPAITPSGFRKPPLKIASRQHPGGKNRKPAEPGAPNDFLKQLVWCYFGLLLVEGAFRKWWLPQLSAPLLIIRDPVVIAIYLLAIQRNIVPR